MNLCTFRISDRWFGVEIDLVKEVVEHARVVGVPHASPDTAGLVNIRGKLHLIVDLRRLFGFESDGDRNDVSLVLFKSSVGESLGVCVDSLGEVISLDASMIEDRRAGEPTDGSLPPDERRKARQGLALGVGRSREGLLVLLDPKGILPALRV